MKHLEGQAHLVQDGGGVESHHPVGADERTFGITEAEPAIDLRSEAQHNRPLSALERYQRKVLSHYYLAFLLAAETAVAPTRGKQPTYQPVNPR
jgi:hypothetical protein